MDPVSSTYGTSTPSALSEMYRTGRQQSTSDSGQPASQPDAPVSGEPGQDKQLGIQPTGNSRDEFRPYGPETAQKKTQSPGDSPSDEKAAKTAIPEKTAKEDPQVQQAIAQLKSIEEKVKAHEAAHKSGGAATGPISYSYTRGPDGRNYITGGEVPITISTGRTPQETISRMQQVIQAALAPADPSPQDRAVAAQAAALQQSARQEQSSSQLTAPDKETASPSPDQSQETGKPDSTASKTDAADIDTPRTSHSTGTPVASATQQSRRAYNDPAVIGSAPTPPPAATDTQQHQSRSVSVYG